MSVYRPLFYELSFGWRSATMYRNEWDRSTVLVAKLKCSHRVEVEIADNVLDDHPKIGRLLSELGVMAQAARKCFCVPGEAA